MEDVETPGATTIDALGDVPRHPASRTAKAAFFVTGDGRFVVAIVRGDYDVNETKLVERGQGDRRTAAGDRSRRSVARGMEAGYGSPIGATRRRRGRRRARHALAEPRRGRQPRRLARPERQRAARLHAGRRRRDHRRPARATPASDCGAPVKLRKGIEVGNIFKLGTDFTDAFGVDVPRRGRRAAPDRHGLVRHRRRPQRGLHRRGAPRREGDRLAGRGRSLRRAPGRDRRGPRAARVRGRRAPPRDRGRGRRPSARSCGTTATSPPASSSPTPSCSACPGS